VGAEEFSGCGGEPASLLHGEWVVEKINGTPLVEESRASVNFGTDNQLSGNASCNQYFGSYALTGEGLTISELGSSMMMCEPPIMDQEMLLQSILREVNRFVIEPNGALFMQWTIARCRQPKTLNQFHALCPPLENCYFSSIAG
jgi:heat shock protein HslJ